LEQSLGSISNGFRDFNGECDAMVDMTLNDLYAKVKAIHFGINRFLIYDFL